MFKHRAPARGERLFLGMHFHETAALAVAVGASAGLIARWLTA
jgi:hypothetical protein